MDKLIIENRSKLPMADATEYATEVILQGKISKTSKGEQYCFVTKFAGGITVYADKNKNSDRLIITKEKK